MKDYMASGSFSRGKEEKAASESMVFGGNINQSVEMLMKTSHLFEPFPDAMAYDTAFLDRIHFTCRGGKFQSIVRISLLISWVLLRIIFPSLCGRCVKVRLVMQSIGILN